MKTRFFYGVAAFATLGLGACSNDDFGGYDPGKAEVDQTQFVTIQITSPKDGTRADYEHGEENESNVESLDFLFYDVNGMPTAARQRFSKTDGTWSGTLNGAQNDNEFETEGNVTSIWTNVVPVELSQGQNIPAQVICLVNATVDRAITISNMTLDELRDEKIGIFSNGNDQFLMTNSVYFGRNLLTGEQNQRLCATPINASQLFDSRKKAQDELDKLKVEGANPDDPNNLFVNIYVERLAAKVNLNMASTAVKSYTLKNGDNEDVTLTFVPEYWFVNAVSKEGYITKRYGVTDGTSINMKPDYTQIDNKFNGTGMAGGNSRTGWNYQADHRSYWGCSPSYYDGSYPKVSDNVDDLEEGTGNATVYPEKYYTYNEVKNGVKVDTEVNGISREYANGFTNSTIYTRETTASIAKIQSGDNPAAVVASAVVVGHYMVDGEDAAHTFYVDRNSGTNGVGVYYADAASAKAALAARQASVFKLAADGTYEPLTAAEITGVYADNFEVEHPKAAVRNLLSNKDIAGRLVTLQLTEVPESEALYMYDLNEDRYVVITSANMATANKNLCGTGYFDMFYNGIAFFSVPIRHLGFGVNVADDKPLITNADGESVEPGKPVKYQWANMRLGDLGVVRNHVYNLTITSIGNGLGTGVRDENQPIVPPVDITESYIAMRLNILAWNVVNSWSVDL